MERDRSRHHRRLIRITIHTPRNARLFPARSRAFYLKPVLKFVQNIAKPDLQTRCQKQKRMQRRLPFPGQRSHRGTVRHLGSHPRWKLRGN